MAKTKTKGKPAAAPSVKSRRMAPINTPTDLAAKATPQLQGSLNALLADFFALYLKTKNFHWHMSGPHFRDYHLLLDEQATQIYTVTDDLAERVRKIGGQTLRSIGDIARHQRVLDNDADFVEPQTMLAELRNDNRDLVVRMREAHELTDELKDVVTTSLLENWIDEAERRAWFLFEATRTTV
jgi:starvation-inducible DNA-binding protein